MKCKYCEKEINGQYRCMDCDVIWQEGFNQGRRSVKLTLKEIFQHLNNLIDLEK